MPKKRKLLSVNEKCRVCLSDDGCMGDIFAEDLRPKINDLAECTSIHINDDDNFPRNICHVCLYKLDMWIDFKTQFIRSNVMLREHLEVSELSDNAASATKRKRSELQESRVDEAGERTNQKKFKSDVPTTSSVSCVNPEGETESTKSCTANNETVTNKESLQKKLPETIPPEDVKDISENASDPVAHARSLSPKVKQIIGRRAKTTERRKASTKRWVARKKALLAATGENDTDSDSMSSDDPQLSPVQKARAKCNAEKVAETHRRIAKALHSNLDSNISGYYGTNADSDSYVVGETDSESKSKINDTDKIHETPTNGSSQQIRLSPNNNVDEKIAKNSLPSSTTVAPRKISPTDISDDFLPNSVRSELIVDDATFVVTSTLVLSDPHYSNPAQPNDSTNAPASEDNRERNTDIIDAVQLRRVWPKTHEKRDKKFVESCLNIEVEGTELDALQRVQKDLASFVEIDMKNKFSCDIANSETKSDVTKDSFQTLDRQLRTIVEKAIKKNLENTRNIVNNRGDKTFTSEFVRAALRSKIFQPRVVLLRLDVKRMLRENEKKSSVHSAKTTKVAEKNSLNDSLSISRGKRRCVQPKKYADYDTSPGISEPDHSRESRVVEEEPKIVVSPGPKSSKVKTYGPASAKQIQPTVNQREIQKPKTVSQTPKTLPLSNDNSSKSLLPNDDESIGERHICGVCGDSFSSRREVEIHFSTHKSPASNVVKQTKQKMMRCKRCHEIVEARNVKLHICRALRSLFKCYSCNSSFKTEKTLTRHLASHSFDDRDGKIDLVPRKESKNKVKNERFVDEPENDCTTNERDNSQSVQQHHQVVGATRESYTCFVCDKTFTDEEILKDHLQQHCDDMSDDQRSNGKDYQCAICGESLDSEDALETHVEKHLFDDEDDNPNLISIGGSNNENEKIEKMPTNDNVRCGQCAEEFDSEMLLMLHMQAHDEEIAIAEWERRGIDGSQHICVICDDVFSTEIELSDHLDIHNGNAHICQLCDKPFLTLEELQSHVNTH